MKKFRDLNIYTKMKPTSLSIKYSKNPYKIYLKEIKRLHKVCSLPPLNEQDLKSLNIMYVFLKDQKCYNPILASFDKLNGLCLMIGIMGNPMIMFTLGNSSLKEMTDFLKIYMFAIKAISNRVSRPCVVRFKQLYFEEYSYILQGFYRDFNILYTPYDYKSSSLRVEGFRNCVEDFEHVCFTALELWAPDLE
jgi:hypothetical protein